MRILFSDRHTYPFAVPVGLGKTVTEWPSGSPKYIHDLMVKALAEMGHEVFYLIKHAKGTIAPPGVQLINKFIDDVDLVHLSARHTPEVALYYQSKNIPVLATNHLYKPNEEPPFKWIHVSKTLADLYNEKQYVWIGLDPDDFIYTTQKKDYFLFMADMSRGMEKGLDIALKLAKERSLNLVVAGSSSLQSDIDCVQVLCDKFKVNYVGDVRGIAKAELLAGARALISPSRLQEASGTTLAEALFSGTPVICSNSGAQNEIISKEVGFVCNNEKEYHQAIFAIDTIDPKTCRAYAMNNFHYRKTTEKYIPIYEEMMATVAK
jgi:glycosyltransferase involved in cell wall biosynthesis